MSPAQEGTRARTGSEWHWLWEVYVVGLCMAAIAAVALLDARFPGHVPLAVAALAGIAVCVLGFRPVIRALDRRAHFVVGAAIGLWIAALWASPIAVAAAPALYPLLFATLPLGMALVGVTAVNLLPLAVALALHGTHWPNLPLAIAITAIGMVAAPVIGTVIVTSMEQRRRLAAVVVELGSSRAEAFRLSRQAGAAAERERLAREIHDTLAQGFTSIVALAQAVEAELDTDPVAASRHVELIRATARENLAEARVMVADLVPAALDDSSLPAAIRRLADRLSAETGITVTVDTGRELPALGMASDVVLLRAAQEALTNVRKHSQGGEVHVELSAAGRGVRFSVVGNGVGLAEDHAEGFGLRGMKARVAQVGGTMSVSPTPGGGVTVEVEVPT
ncbi:sensor histidine kinase [Mycobacterium sp. AZCC_0083]|uniref:sensor histidine kinase n=1 Tax=Mycobacterium sp. AZCC_0083 TaxID=2735882 RepID=UPI00161654B9|nr:sensor histidine kinase [Mycobacterium sp. AZCC_0083]MBB5167027.1 signal transduction histidine kinase [Mycobacterium sp. AZCC_0083]